MLVLGIDTSTMVGSVALLADDTLIGEYTLNLKRTHSERLMVAVEQLFGTAGVVPGDIQGIAVALGPGSYTGIRIGVTTAKLLAWALHIPLVGIGTLEALARAVSAFPANGVIAPAISAKGTLVFGAVYDPGDEYKAVIEPEALEVPEFVKSLGNLNRPIIPLGDGYYDHEIAYGRLKEAGLLATRVPKSQGLPRASLVALVGLEKLAQGVNHNPSTLAPIYLRAPEAEVVWERKHVSLSAKGEHNDDPATCTCIH